MPKGKLNLIDVRAISTELRYKLLGCRLINVYNLNSKTFLFKFALRSHLSAKQDKKNDYESDQKVYLVLESGIRAHTTNFVLVKSDTPNGAMTSFFSAVFLFFL